MPVQSVRCKGENPQAIWLLNNGVVRVYPSPDIAASWDPFWNEPKTIDCSVYTRGSPVGMYTRSQAASSEYIDLERATREYRNAKQNYQRLVRLALDESNAAARQSRFQAIRNENARLVHIVENLVQAWNAIPDHDDAQENVDDLNNDLEEFKRQLESLHRGRDTIVQLESVLSSFVTKNESMRNTYYWYIIAVLLSLVSVFVFFVISYVRGAATAAAAAVAAAATVVEPLTDTAS
jgi:DNA repair exonuclease SbcCD ATPase subunit